MFGKPLSQQRPFGHNAGGVNIVVHDVIVVLDLLEVHRIAETRGLEEIASIAP